MIYRVVLVFALLDLGSIHSLKLPSWPRLSKPHIIGGETAKIQDFPYQVSLRKRGEPYGYGHVCGASIVDDRHVLTAAHCVPRWSIPNLYFIVANSNNLENGASFNIEKIDIHNKWNSRDPYAIDVAVITLQNKLDFTETQNIKAVPMVPMGEEPSAGSAVVVAGWGRTILGNRRPELDYSDLMKVELDIVDRDSCDKCLGGTGKIDGRLICAGVGVQGEQIKDTSVGDSGGPLVDIKTGMQVGIVSFGSDSISSMCPGAYTNLANKEVRQFIDQVLAS